MNNEKVIDMKSYGLDDRVTAFVPDDTSLTVARVITQAKGLYRVVCEKGEFTAEVSGKLMYNASNVSDFPAVGDFVAISVTSPETAVIKSVLPRKSVFIRKAAGTGNSDQVVAANIDTLFICMSLNNDFNLRRLERYLAATWNSGAVPVAVLTKADLCADIEEKLEAVRAVAGAVDVLCVSSVETDGFAAVLPFIVKGRTVALTGSSGVGKSTLINRLIGDNVLDTNGLRNDDKGRHTTTCRELIVLPSGGIVIDTPGMRELGIIDGGEGIDDAFDDIAEIMSGCRFRDCTHTNEPGCAVKAALADGSLDASRWASYNKLKNEAAAGSMSKSARLSEKEKKFKQIAIINRRNGK